MCVCEFLTNQVMVTQQHICRCSVREVVKLKTSSDVVLRSNHFVVARSEVTWKSITLKRLITPPGAVEETRSHSLFTIFIISIALIREREKSDYR